MAFTTATFAKGPGDSQGIAPRLWLYATGDNITDLDVADYWAGAYARGARAGDVVLAVCADGGAHVHISALTLTTSTAALFA